MNKIILLMVVFFIASMSLITAGVPPPVGDSDNDGVPDSQDLCLNTEAGQIVNSDGYSILQLCSGNWENHGQYVSCVARTSKIFIELGLITEEHGAIVSEAAQSEIGKK